MKLEVVFTDSNAQKTTKNMILDTNFIKISLLKTILETSDAAAYNVPCDVLQFEHMRRFVKLVPDFLMCLESKRGDPPCTPRLFGVLVLRAQKELDKSLEDGHRK